MSYSYRWRLFSRSLRHSNTGFRMPYISVILGAVLLAVIARASTVIGRFLRVYDRVTQARSSVG